MQESQLCSRKEEVFMLIISSFLVFYTYLLGLFHEET